MARAFNDRSRLSCASLAAISAAAGALAAYPAPSATWNEYDGRVIDSDSDGVFDIQDPVPTNPDVCGDSDADTCDDCSLGTDDFGPLPDSDPANDGPDGDGDGACDAGDNCPATPNTDQADFDADATGDACDPDDDNDGVLDGADCAPLSRGVASVPAAIGPTLRLDRQPAASQQALGQAAVLTWSRSWQGHTSNIYRGTITPGEPWGHDETCLDANETQTQTIDDEDPGAGSAFDYLAGAANLCGESAIGLDSAGAEIHPTLPCPASTADGDAEGVPDLEDNCPLTANSDQSDIDLDFVGNPCDEGP